jgi:hypothetical protein
VHPLIETRPRGLCKSLRWKPWEGFQPLRHRHPPCLPPRFARPRAMIRGQRSWPAPHALRWKPCEGTPFKVFTGPIPKPSPRRLVLTQIVRRSDRKDEQGGTEEQREQGLGLRDGGARTEVTVDFDASRDDLSGKPILSLFLCSSPFHLRPGLTRPATPKPGSPRSSSRSS